jgi:SAM-dependent MidA family methyltransferase
MKASTATAAYPAILGALRERAQGRPALSFAEFMDVALYTPAIGYYRKTGPRVGYDEGTDFLTASSSPLFGRLVVEACVQLLAPSRPADFEFVEIGAEPGGGILRDLSHPFGSARQVRVGESLRIQGPSVVFSNELFDAQPFRRFRFRAGAWRELGVSLGGDSLTEVEIESALPVSAAFPPSAPEGYVIDAPFASATLATTLAAQPWSGLFLAFDYGKSWEEIAFATPAGTARAYLRHSQGNELLAFPGEQDLTCHVCWDWLSEALSGCQFALPQVASQEAFFVRHCAGLIENLSTSQAGQLSRDKMSLMQLLHPGNMGQRFQALWALRRDPARSG